MSAQSLIKKNKLPKTNSGFDVWDYIIIGAGITGLYAAHRIRQYTDPRTRILVIEAGCRIGGRMAMVDFHGVNVEPGAGIGRLEKDKVLRGLLEELGIKWTEFPVAHNYSPVVYKSEITNNGGINGGIKPKNKILRLVVRNAQKKIELPQPTPKLQTPDWIKKQVGKLRAAYKKTPATTTFHAFAQKILGRRGYKQLVLALGYTDYEKEDIAETLFNYGLDDLYAHWTGMGINWQALMDSLIKHSFADIRLNTSAVSINRNDQYFTINTINTPNIQTSHTKYTTQKQQKRLHSSNKSKTLKAATLNPHKIPNLPTSNSIGCQQRATGLKPKKLASRNEFRGRKVLIATTIGPARELVSNFMLGQGLRVPVHLSGVSAQSFLRIYGYFTGTNFEVMQKYCQHTQVVPGGYHRVIPMGSGDGGKSGVYMIVYTDNQAADNLEHLRTNTPTNRQQLATGLKTALGIPTDTILEITEILGYYWREGTHYYTPLNHRKFGTRDEFLAKVQRPMGTQGGLFLVGEAFSRQQGWTEGALESVDAVLGDLL
jgi:hypothetical protein